MTELEALPRGTRAALKRYVRTELLIRRLISEAEASDEKKEKRFRHPAFLLVLTFLLTGVVGSADVVPTVVEIWSGGSPSPE